MAFSVLIGFIHPHLAILFRGWLFFGVTWVPSVARAKPRSSPPIDNCSRMTSVRRSLTGRRSPASASCLCRVPRPNKISKPIPVRTTGVSVPPEHDRREPACHHRHHGGRHSVNKAVIDRGIGDESLEA